MSKRMRSKIRRHKQNRSPITLLALLFVWSISLGWGIALTLGQATPSLALEGTATKDFIAQATSEEIGTVDPINPNYQLGKELYLDNCASCHVPLPPEVLPSETWRRLLQEQQQHFGVQLKPMIGPSLVLMWNYIRAYSRPEKEGKPLPYRISESPYFKALHPRVKFPQTVKPASCVTCHPAAPEFNYRRLTPEWENSP